MSNEVSIFHFIVGFVCGHLCGSIPSGLWIVRSLFGIDIREYGSKNIGTTNVFRTVGAKAALLVLVIDVIKGILAVAAMNYLFADPLLNVVTALLFCFLRLQRRQGRCYRFGPFGIFDAESIIRMFSGMAGFSSGD